ncbi:MAG: hypothetical protein Kow0080_13510 [Candidatus Promineifilaceae bacterium]
MYRAKKYGILFYLVWMGLLLGLVACAGEQPTVAPTPVASTAVSPTNAPADVTTAVPPTETAVPTDAPTAQPQPTETAVLPTATPVVYTLNVSTPLPGSDVVVGQEVVFSGVLQPAPVESVDVRVKIGSRVVMSGFAQVNPADGSWLLTQTIPPNIVGPAELVVAQSELGLETAVSINLTPSLRSTDTYVTLERPSTGTTLAAGHPVFLAGQLNNAIDNTIHMGVLVDDCTTFVSSISFELSSGYWNGFLILPGDIQGEGCVVAYTGNFGEGDWREARLPVTIVDPNVEPFYHVEIGNLDTVTVNAGETAVWYGSAVKPVNSEVHVMLLTDVAGQTTQVLYDSTVSTDAFGYWEVQIPVPDTFTGSALLIVTSGSDDTYAEARLPIMIKP